ncbi:hypothetical protein [Paenibacillus sp. PL2-23]|uniref:hypothetical protein n=1 Tax=Paenibacillus sp. PL2-23 TaxID=2100729 RepID=UPI0030F70903
MDLKSKARLAGWFEPAEWTKEMDMYRSLLEQETHFPLPNDTLLHYVDGLNEREKLSIALTLEFPFAKRELRKWPDMLFVKMLRTAFQQAQRSLAMKRRVLLAIFQLLPLEGGMSRTFECMLEERDQLIAGYGYWAYYWLLYFHPFKTENQETWLFELKRLEERERSAPAAQQAPSSDAQALDVSTASPGNGKPDKKLKLLENMYKKELSARQRLEHELAQKDKLLRMKAKELHQLEEALERMRVEAERAAFRWDQEIRQREERGRRWKREQADWLEERQSFIQHTRSLNAQQVQLQRALEAQENTIREQAAEIALLDEELQDVSRQQRDADEWAAPFSQSLQHKLAELGQALASGGSSAPTRNRLRVTLDLLDALEAYQAISLACATAMPSPAAVEVDEQQLAQTAAADQLHHAGNASAADAGPARLPALYGTFARRDHGGSITLENGDSFNITESLVQQHELQHEAELLCTPVQQPGRPTYYELELLFQGDDAYSPIQQFDGYIEKGEGPLWFCVDMNDPASRFQLHHRDVDIQRPSPGDPCIFNVADGSHIARLVRLYRQSGSVTPPDGAKQRQSAQEQPELTAAARRNKDKREQPRPHNEPFLQNCVITIVGGVRKWFESVVRECGAELAHDTGDHPDRVMAQLQRSQALFLLITSTSHRATWEGIHIAKSNGIPHFVIQGSKSNLRSLLWEHRALIIASNR